MKNRIPPPIITLFFGVMMWIVDRYLPILSFQSLTANYFGFCLIAIGGAIDLHAVTGFVRAKTTVNPLSPENASTLVIEGIYKLTRNPMYLGMLLILIGWAVYLGSLAPLLIAPLFVMTINQLQIIPEEEALAKRFGSQYMDYKKSVRRWI